MWQLMIEFRNGGAVILRADRDTVFAWVEEVQQTRLWSAIRIFDDRGALQDSKGVLLV
ncbi:MAG: hypothetical protein JNL96_28825 [Planctomycetaceae bacterium]|nr:hypothetical protein [Planctomycetaceae bacterium]